MGPGSVRRRLTAGAAALAGLGMVGLVAGTPGATAGAATPGHTVITISGGANAAPPAEDWSQLSPTTAPSSRAGAAMAYDRATGQLILFGGNDGVDEADTWSWSGTDWTQLQPADSPGPRDDAAMAFDSATGQLLLYGGVGSSGDTWAWTGTDWSDVTPASNNPAAVSGASMAYDPTSGRLLLFGGTGASGPVADTWSWDGKAWSPLKVATSPPARFDASLAFDPAAGRPVLFGGTGMVQGVLSTLDDTWTWDGSTWADATSKVPTDSPPARTAASMAFDPATGQLVLFGGGQTAGRNPLYDGDTWVLPSGAGGAGGLGGGNGGTAKWTQWESNKSPGARASAAMAYDPATGQLLLSGGSQAVPPPGPSTRAPVILGLQSETWSFGPVSAQAPVVTVQPLDAAGPVGSAVSFTAAATGEPFPTVQWEVSTDGGRTFAPLPQTSPPAVLNGALSSTLSIGDIDNDGRYEAVFTNASGATTSSVATLTVGPPPVPPSCTPGDRAWVCHLYLTLLDRSPDPGGMSTALDLLGAGETRTQVALGVLQSPEFRSDLVQFDYTHFLDRAGAPQELAFWVGQLGTGQSDSFVLANIVGSQEYFAIHGGTNDGWLDGAYQDLLGRPPDPAGRQYHLAQLLYSGLTRTQVAADMLSSPEYRTLQVLRDYEGILQRAADPGGILHYVGLLGTTGTPEVVESRMLGSAECYVMTFDGTAWLGAVYRDLLHREVDPGGLAAYAAFIEGDPDRPIIIGDIISSPEYRSDVIDALYVHYLHRHADPGGLSAALQFLQSGGTDEQLASIIIGSPEYLALHGGTNDGWLDAVYSDVLNRPPDPGGRATFTQALSFNVSRQQVAFEILGSDESLSDQINADYQLFLGRPADPSGITAWLGFLHQGGKLEQVVIGLISSPEFSADHAATGLVPNGLLS